VRAFREVAVADERLLDVLDIPFVRGDRSTALVGPYKMAISTEIARAYFGDEDPLGKRLRWDTSYDVQVSGVYELPANSHFPVPMLMSMSTIWVEPAYDSVTPQDWWGSSTGAYLYVMTREATPIDSFGQRLLASVGEHFQWEIDQLGERDAPYFELQPVADIHLHSHTGNELEPGTRISYVKLLAAIGLFVLVIACANFVSLATARSLERAREVGMRKVIGAGQGQLRLQFLCESALQVALAAGFAFIAAQLALPAFGALAGREVAEGFAGQGRTAWLLLGLMAIAGLGAGYPALVLAGTHPHRVLKDASKSGTLGSMVRRRLVAFQFALSILLVLATAAAHQQLRFLQTADVGFRRQHTLVFRVGYPGVKEHSELMAQRMAELPSVRGVSRFHHPPFSRLTTGRYGQITVGDAGQAMEMAVISIDEAFVPLMGIDVIAGRSVGSGLGPRQVEALLNESSVAALGYAEIGDVLGQPVDMQWRGKATVVGVVGDFHYESLHHPVGPTLLRSPRFPDRRSVTPYYSYVGVGLAAGAALHGVRDVEEVWDSFASGYPFTYWFLDDAFDRQYRDEQRLARLLAWFAGLAVFVAALGVFALAAFSVRQRTREIGVRKVLGASTRAILLLLGRDFGGLFLGGALVAWPLGYWAMGRWLDGFAYRAEPGVMLFAGATGLVLLAAVLAVGQQVMVAAGSDPVEALRRE